MKKLLILATTLASSCMLFAQNPVSIGLPKEPATANSHPNPDVVCNNFAGTFTLGPTGTNTQSNDLTLDTLYLCGGDSIFIDHNGDFNLSGDPNPATTPGISYAFYTCSPNNTGPTLQNIIGSALPPLAPDPCLLSTPPAANGIWVSPSTPNGDTWFFNSGFLQTNFNAGLPMLLHFAPITIDNVATNGFEPAAQGFPPGPCVNVNTASSFEVVYLNPIQMIGFTNPYQGNNCLGRFKIEGGFPEWQANALYTVDIYLKSDPSVKALIANPSNQIKSNVSLVFSIPQPGTYVVRIEDGKSCGLMQEVNMTTCNGADNIVFQLPASTQVEPGDTFCLPITTSNYTDVQGFSFSLGWDPGLFQLLPGANNFIQNVNPDLVDFDPVIFTNTTQANNGFLGIVNIATIPATLSPNEVLMEVCFQSISQQDSVCSAVVFTNTPSAVNASNSVGQELAFEGIPGEVCVEYDSVAITAVPQPLGCNSSNLGYQITITGGLPPYELSWQELPAGAVPSAAGINANTPFFITLTPTGTYPVQYRLVAIPQNGIDVFNADTLILTIDQPQTLGAALNLTDLPTCNGGSDGAVSAQVFLGSTLVTDLTGFSFNWTKNGVPVSGGATLSNVSSGTYNVTVTQLSTGCTAVASGTLGNPPAMNDGAVQITPATCTGVADGEIVFPMTGGNPFSGGAYQFQVLYAEDCSNPNKQVIDNNGLGNPYVRTDLLPGCYKFVVTDASGCVFTDSVTVFATRNVSLSETNAVSPTCFGLTNGVLSVSITETPAQPGGPVYDFSWLPIGSATSGVITPAGPGANSTNTGVSAGSFFVTAVNALGCSDTLTVELGQPAQFIVAPLTVNNPTCVNVTSGALSVIGLGGAGNPANFTYNWNPTATGSALSNLGAGTYSVTATDANGCTAVFDTTLALPPAPVINGITTTPLVCGNDGALTVNAPTAVAFNWAATGGSVINTPNLATISGLAGDTYTVTITDANGCTNTSSATLSPVQPLAVASSTVVNPSCFGYNNGSIAIGVAGGTPGYSYNWSTTAAPPNSPVIPAILSAGTYSVTVTDSKNCTATTSFNLVDPPQIAVVVASATPTTCFGDCNGALTITASYQPGSDFNFVWQDGGSTDSIRTNLCSGVTTVTVTEQSATQCFVIQELTVPSPAPVTIDPTETTLKDVTCNGGADGNICIVGTGGNSAPYSYAWAQGGTTNCLFNLTQGNYTVTITDNTGCTGTYTAVVDQPTPIAINQDLSNSLEISCFGDDDGALAVIASGGNTAPVGVTQYTYAWSDGSNQIGTTNPISMLMAGSYSVTVSDYLGCTGSTALNLFDPPAVQGDYVLGEPLRCYGDETTINVINVQGGSGGPFTYTIDYGVPITTDLGSIITGGAHFLTFLDKKGCENTIEIVVPEPDEIIITFSPQMVELELGDSLTLTPFITGSTPASFQWEPASFFTNPDTLQPNLYTFQSGTVTLTVTDANGCTGVGSVNIQVDPNRNVYIPNIFNPGNRFGENDYFMPGVGVGVETINYMRVYDRWGQLLYEREAFLPTDLELTSGWDGRFRGKFVDPGVYVYAIEVKFLDKKVLLYRGDITVVR